MIIMLMRMLPMLLLLAEDKTDLFHGKDLLDLVMTLIGNTINGFTAIVDGLNGVVIDTDIDLTAFGQTLTALFFITQAFEQMTDFRFDRMEDGVRLGLKFIMAKVIIENSSTIVENIYTGIFENYGLNEISKEMSNFSITMDSNYNSNAIEPGLLGVNYLLSALLMLGVWGIMMCMLVKMAAMIAGILFEIAMHKVVAPIALSTLCNDTAKSCGVSFIKSYVAVCLQACVIAICFHLYNPISEAIRNTSENFLGGSTSVVQSTFIVDVFSVLSPLISIVILSTTVTKSGDITKRMLGA